MSRAGAAFGSAVGLALGGTIGGYTVLTALEGGSNPHRASNEALFNGAVIGAFVGVIAGAAIGAGPKEPPHQVGTSGHLSPVRGFP